MSAPVVLRWPLPVGSVDGLGQPFACPDCGTVEGVLIAMDLEDHSDAPSTMGCPQNHTWLEERLPRHVGASLLADILDIEPALLGRLEELQGVHGQQ